MNGTISQLEEPQHPTRVAYSKYLYSFISSLGLFNLSLFLLIVTLPHTSPSIYIMINLSPLHSMHGQTTGVVASALRLFAFPTTTP
jgi:hypothetical protein